MYSHGKEHVSKLPYQLLLLLLAAVTAAAAAAAVCLLCLLVLLQCCCCSLHQLRQAVMQLSLLQFKLLQLHIV
jgi:hypothetical protein